MRRHSSPMEAPSFLLLLWCGFVATFAAALIGSLLGTRTAVSWALLPRATTAQALAASLLAGMVIYPLIYGLIFESFHRADAKIGLLLGTLHALIALAIGIPTTHARNALRLAAMHFAYGITIAFLYVAP